MRAKIVLRFVLVCALIAAPFVACAEDAAIRPGDPMLPNGYTIAARLNCGVETETGGNAVRIAVTAGQSHMFPGIDGAQGTAAREKDRVEAEVSGLRGDGNYVLGFTWWDADRAGRVQSVQFAAGESWETVLPAAPAAAFHRDESTWARVLLPVPATHVRNGVLRVAFVNEGGPDAVVNEIWVLEKMRADERKRVLIVTGDDYPGHLWRETAPEFAAILREDPRLEVSICEAPAVYGSPLLDHYDATLLHFKNYAERLPLGQAVWDGLARHVASGRGLVIAHFGCGAFQEWDGFVDAAGRIWDPALRAHDPYGPFTVRVADPNHPVTDGMDDFETSDELYTCLAGGTPIRVLCESTSVVDGKDYPMAFQVEETGGRVIHCILGHDVAALSASGAREFYRRAGAWAAGL